MADKKKAASKPKGAAKKPRTTGYIQRKPAVVERKKVITYDDLYAARQEMNNCHADVLQAELEMNSAYANQGDFAARDRDTEAALVILNEARSRATAATTKFQILKMEARK